MIPVMHTAYPIAEGSLDHQYPHGAVRDCSVNPEFNRRLMEVFPQARLLDLGCAGGCLVESILADGGFAVGVEGSDAPRERGLGAWPRIPGHLMTADISRPFTLYDGHRIARFDVVTAWEVFEHIQEHDLDQLLHNVTNHLTPNGVLIASIATTEYWSQEQVQYHRTVRPAEWWLEFLGDCGFRYQTDLTAVFDGAWVRGHNTGEVTSLCGVWAW